MTKADQLRIIRELSDSITCGMMEKIEHGELPEEWDGHELRQYFAYLADVSTSDALRKGTRRRREFENYLLVNNL